MKLNVKKVHGNIYPEHCKAEHQHKKQKKGKR